MRCPECDVRFHFNSQDHFTLTVDDLLAGRRNYQFSGANCPECEAAIVVRQEATSIGPGLNTLGEAEVVFPTPTKVPVVSPEVPPEYANDFREAHSVLHLSPKSSAALSRRVLQKLLHNHFQIRKRELVEEIKELLGKNLLPTHLAENLDAIRNVGNFAAHPTKDTNTTAIIAVEPGEAEWTLELIDQLFDFCFVQPAKAKKSRDSLNAKLAAAGKKPMM